MDELQNGSSIFSLTTASKMRMHHRPQSGRSIKKVFYKFIIPFHFYISILYPNSSLPKIQLFEK